MRIIAVGEITWDIFFREGKPVGAAVGGSQLNSAVTLGRCGLPVCLVSSTGNDPTGNLSIDFLSKNGVNIEFIRRFEGNSRIALAFFNERGDASYSIYPASQTVSPYWPDPQPDDLILFGSSFALRSEGRQELTAFLRLAKERGATLLYDPNIRRNPEGDAALKAMILENMGFSTIVKGSVEDFLPLFGTTDPETIHHEVLQTGAAILFITKGNEGAELFAPGCRLSLPAMPVEVVSTVGAGDNFSAGVIHRLFRLRESGFQLAELKEEQWLQVLQAAVLFSAEVCQSAENYLPLRFVQQL